MFSTRFLRHSVLTLSFFLVVACAYAQPRPEVKEYQPTVGQAGRDVVWVPTALALTNKMLDMAKVTPRDYVIDLGSGDGRIVIAAAKRGARALGIEYNPELVALSRRHAVKEGVADRAQFVQADLFTSDFSQATVITLFLLPELNLKLRPTILNLKPGTRIVSNSFDMGDWKPDQTVVVSREDGCENYCTGYFWIVPAKVEGIWKFSPGQGELRLLQSYQVVSGTLKSGGTSAEITNGVLNGDQISFHAGDTIYAGRITGNNIEGTATKGGRAVKWRASRASK